MKWNKAIAQIEKAIADGKVVEVSFHRKWARNCNEYKTDKVDKVVSYDWHGEECKFVDTWEGYGLEECNFIIDDVIVEADQEQAEEEPTEAERPESGWTYLYTDTNTYNVDMDVYMTEDGRLVMVDSDWMF